MFFYENISGDRAMFQEIGGGTETHKLCKLAKAQGGQNYFQRGEMSPSNPLKTLFAHFVI